MSGVCLRMVRHREVVAYRNLSKVHFIIDNPTKDRAVGRLAERCKLGNRSCKESAAFLKYI